MNLATPSATPAPQLKDIVPPQPYHLPGDYLWLAVAVVALAGAAYFAWRCWRRRPRKAAPRLSPRQLAEQRLADLRGRAPGLDPRVFGAEVCTILSGYIGEVYAFHPERQTSEEFLAAMAAHRIFSPAQHDALGHFLTQCDLLKFARLDAADEGKSRLIEQAADFIQSAGASAQPLAVAGGGAIQR